MRISTKILIPSLITLFLLVAFGVHLYRETGRERKLLTQGAERISSINSFARSVNELSDHITNTIVAFQFDRDPLHLQQIREIEARIRVLLALQLATVDSNRGRNLFLVHIKSRQSNERVLQKFLEAISRERPQEIALAFERWNMHSRYTEATLDDLLSFLTFEVDRATQDIQGGEESVHRLLTYLISFAFLAVLVSAVYYNRVITRPLRRITVIARNISRGDLTSKIESFNQKDELGELAQALHQMTDNLIEANITLERRVADRTEELRASEEQIRTIVETANDAVISADGNGTIISFNRAAEEIFGYARDEALGHSLTLLMPERFHESHAQGLNRFLATQEARVVGKTVEVVGRKKDGGEFPVELSLASWGSGDAVFFTGILRDITERKRVEAEIAAKNRDLETLLYVISHDLREPLRAIENFSRMLDERYSNRLDEKGRDFLTRVVRGGRRMNRLLDDLLALSRAQRIGPAIEETDMEAIVGEAVSRLDGKIHETGAMLTVLEGLPRLYVDRTWMTQAVYNLIANALKFTCNGESPEIEIAPYRNGAQTGIVVRDRGPGVELEHAERIFQLFERAVGREVEGTGAGLAIVRQIAERHGGKAWVQPRAGGGSEFIIAIGHSSLLAK